MKWQTAGHASAVSGGDEAGAAVEAAWAKGRSETIFTSETGRICYFVTNGVRVMVMLLDEPGDPGGHAASPGATGYSSGFVLSNGQDDEYPDEATVPWDEAIAVLRAIIDGRPIPGTWVSDR